VYKPEIDEVLARHLGRVSAPEELWERIENPRARVPVPRARTLRVKALIAVAVMMVITIVVFQTRRRTVEVEYRLTQHNAACFLCHAGG
jgi:hypothetical protein